jgi:hypothetical protein
MAKKGSAAAGASDAGESNGATSGAVAPPSGFRRRSTVSDAPWVKQETGNTVFGKLIGRYLMQGAGVQGGSRYYYQIELLWPCTATKGSGEEAETVDAKKGDIVNLGEQFKLKVLAEHEWPEILAGAAYDVWAQYKKKIKIGGGRTMWDIDVHTKCTQAPTRQVRPLPPEGVPAAEGDGDSEEAPF